MDRNEMVRLFEAHREAEAARDIDAILETFVTDCFLETVPLGLEATAGTPSEQRTSNSSSARSPIWLRRTRASPSVTMSALSGERCAEPAAASGLASRPARVPSPCPSPMSSHSARG